MSELLKRFVTKAENKDIIDQFYLDLSLILINTDYISLKFYSLKILETIIRTCKYSQESTVITVAGITAWIENNDLFT